MTHLWTTPNQSEIGTLQWRYNQAMKSNIEADSAEPVSESPIPKRISVCLLTRIAFYGCLALVLVTLGIFLITNLKGQ
ncbi:hypothetical protein IAD21_00513 [Abditibacteriota bacterium]|nr:hypothetical protein IAD21_00513 [Abditibacteriota bacterium]